MFRADPVHSPSSTMNWLRVFTAKLRSGQVLTRYIKDPISYRYKVASTNSDSKAISFQKLMVIRVAIG